MININLFKKILRLLILFLIIFIIFIKFKKYKITNFQSDFYKNIYSLTKEDKVKIYNVNNNIKTIDNLLKNKITIVNIYNYDDINYLKNINLFKYIENNYSNIDIFDIVIKNKDIIINDNILNLIDDKIDILIKNNRIKHPVLYVDEYLLEKKLNMYNLKNKIIILDELANIKYILDNKINTIELDNKIKNISKQTKYFYKKNINTDNKYNEDSDFINSLDKIIIIEENKHSPLFAILDSNSKRILITKINGEIIYNITSKNLCLPTSLKYINKKLYVTDLCDNSIKIINFKKQKIDQFIKNENLFGITDFEFLDKNNLLISKKDNYGIGIFDIKNNIFTPLNEKLNLDYKIGKVNKIIKHTNKYYYFDSTNNILYSFDNIENKMESNLNEYDNIILYDEIESFYINEKDNVYFLDTKNNKILHKIKNQIFEKNFNSFLYLPNDMLIFKNIIYITSNNIIQKINLYNNKYENINLFFSKNRKIFFDIDENIEIKNISNINSQNITINNNKFSLNNLIDNINIVPYSPSFLAIFEREKKNKLILNKILFYDNLINKNKINIENNKEYILYGKIYYNDDNIIKIKNIDNVILSVTN